MTPLSDLIREWWHRRQRRIDLTILWPAIHAQASGLDNAKEAFRTHAFSDPAWNGIAWPEIERMLHAETFKHLKGD